MPHRRSVLIFVALTVPCPSQTTAPAPTFEVASVKPTEHGRNAAGLSVSSDPQATSPGTFTVTNNSLDELIRWAYNVKEYQLSGPNWLNDDSECFDIRAKMPPDTPKDQLRSMMQALLEDRFKLALHRETRTLPIYELHLAKNGAKLDQPDAGAKAGIA